MSALIDHLPGIGMPIRDVETTLSQMWQADPGSRAGGEAPSEFRASQMNLVLHFGADTEPEELVTCFRNAVHFAQRYPCRIVVLCPGTNRTSEQEPLEGKLYAQCFIGKRQREMCCCEALILGYEHEEKDFLENQLSVWLENDLPTYYWFHRVATEDICTHYLPLTFRCQRIIYDSTIGNTDMMTVPWKQPAVLHDLAFARLLPVRQCIGQFLSSLPSQTITDGLERVSVRGPAQLCGETQRLLDWIEAAICGCCELDAKARPQFERTESETELEVELQYAQEEVYFRWHFNQVQKRAHIAASYGPIQADQPSQVELLSPVKAIAESLFFEENRG